MSCPATRDISDAPFPGPDGPVTTLECDLADGHGGAHAAYIFGRTGTHIAYGQGADGGDVSIPIDMPPSARWTDDPDASLA